jgi:hypothetical protein
VVILLQRQGELRSEMGGLEKVGVTAWIMSAFQKFGQEGKY